MRSSTSTAALISTNTRAAADLLGSLPAVAHVSAEQVAAMARTARRLIVLDDDPTGTQTVVDVPIVTTWDQDDLRWALGQDCCGFYVETNTRSLEPAAAVDRNEAVMCALAEVISEVNVEVAVVSRSDSTLRGHFPLETDVLTRAWEKRFGGAVDGIVIVPAYIDAGRITIDSMHWVRTRDGFVPAGESEFAADPAFSYHASDLREYVAEKTGGHWHSADVARITLAQLRHGDVGAVTETLRNLRGARPVVVDAVADEDLRVLAMAAIAAEQAGSRFVYRVGPSFVRNRLGQEARPPLAGEPLAALVRRPGTVDSAPRANGGLVVVGSFVPLTTRQLGQLEAAGGTSHLTLEVPELLGTENPAALVSALADQAVALLARGDVVVQTSRHLVASDDGQGFASAARVSAALVSVVRSVITRTTPRWILAKGGITSSDLATHALGIRRAWARGTLLPGIVSLWEPVDSACPVPYVVFAGNVGDEDSLAAVVARLREAG